MIGKPDWMFNVLPLALLTASYVFYQKRKKLLAARAGNQSAVAFNGAIA
jgi:hypothetical protein